MKDHGFADNTLEVRRAEPGDFMDIAALDRVAWLGNRKGDFIPDGEHVWRLWTEYAWCYVARVNDKSGLAGAPKGASEGTLVGAIVAFPCLDGRYCVHKVMVLPELRQRGIGSKLFARLLEELDRTGEATFLTVDPANQAALALYASWGYEQDSFVSGFYRPEEDRWILVRKGSKP